MDQETREKIKLKIIKQQREAFEISKTLLSISSKDVSYLVSTKIYLQNDKYIPVTIVKEFPEIRIGHDTDEEDLNFLKTHVIDNLEG